jgi:hypothetical protein
VIAESLLLKQQLTTHSRSRQHAPNLSTQDRTVLGFLSLFLNPRRLARSAIIIRRVLAIHYKPDPRNRGPSWLTTIGHAKDSLWSRDAGPVDLLRCESTLPKSHWVMVVIDQYTRRIIGFSVHAGNVDGTALCRMRSRMYQCRILFFTHRSGEEPNTPSDFYRDLGQDP